MKRLPLIIVISILALGVAGYFFYQYRFVEKRITAWDIIPNDALIVYEKGSCESCVEQIQRSSVWQVISQASFYGEPDDSLRGMLMKDLQATDNLFVSIHAIKKDDFDFVFYLEDAPSLSGFQKLSTKSFYRHTEREFNGIKIHEVGFSKHVFSWAMINNAWVGSFTPFLIEDVIRTSLRNEGLRKRLTQLETMPRIEEDAGNLYIKLDNFSDWLALFHTERDFLRAPFAQSAVLDVKDEQNTILLNGFSAEDPVATRNILSVFRSQSPVSFSLKNIISARTICLQTFGVSNGAGLMNDISSYRKRTNARLQDSLLKITQGARINAEIFYQNIEDEINLCFTESNRGNRLSRILVVETKNSDSWIGAMNKISATFSKDTIFFERYSDYEIREVPVFNFPEKLFWPLVSGFSKSYYTSIGNTVVIGEDLSDLKSFLVDIDEDHTWGKSVGHNKFLESTLLESSISLYVNTPRIWTYIAKNLHPRWAEFVKRNQSAINAVQMSAFQFSHLNNTYYTNVSINHKKYNGGDDDNRSRDKYISSFAASLQGLYPVRSHVSRGDELLVQDSLNDLSLVTTDGKVLWKVAIGDRITSEVSQIDYYANGKLQYFFTTRSALHVLDRLGNYVDPFPVFVKPTLIERAQVIDYDRSKKYRFLIGEEDGKLWMFDKEGNNLEGWQPRYTNGKLLTEPRHHRIMGKDYIIAIRRDGVVYLMNRRGEDVRGFPLKLETTLAGDYFVEQGGSTEDTYFVVVSADGFRIKFNVDGKVQSKETLLKTSFNTQFALIGEKLNKSYLIMRQDTKGFSLLDENGQVIISNDAIGSKSVAVNFYDFGSGKKYISVTDQGQDLTYVYDMEGSLLTLPPLETSLLELRPIDSEQIRAFFIHGNTLSIQPL